MAEIRKHLARAPITEALIDLQINRSAGVELSKVQRFGDELKGSYRSQGPIIRFSTNVSVSKDDGPKSNTSASELGIRLSSIDEKYVVQARTNGFALSRLEPYETWDNLVAEAKRLWMIYQEHVQSETVVRVASRFINHLKLPIKAGESFEEYLTKPPDVPPGLPQGVLGFMQRVVLFEPDRELRANVVQLLQEGSAPLDHVPVILDIDVYKRVELSPDADAIWRTLNDVRAFKNSIFFASLTERTVGLLE